MANTENDSLPWLRSRTILVTMAGSRAYGTNTATSDVDIKGVCVPPREYFLGYATRFEQADKVTHATKFLDTLPEDAREMAKATKLEGVIFDIRKFFSLAALGSSDIWELLFGADGDILVCGPLGYKLRTHRDLFLSKAIVKCFVGHAHSLWRSACCGNPKNLNKSYMHIVRLLRISLELLSGVGLQIQRPDSEELVAIRKGAWTHDQVSEFFTQTNGEIDSQWGLSRLPSRVNSQQLNEFCMELVESSLNEG